MKCGLCSSSDIEVIDIRHASFRHVGFATMKQSGCIGRCATCQLLFNIVTAEEIKEIENLFKSFEYSQYKYMSHILSVKNHEKPVTRAFLQAQLLHDLLDERKPCILDIGCFDGELLIELGRRFECAELHGFDINEHIRSVFPRDRNFHFWTTDLRKVQGSFDVISLSGSIMYIRDIPGLMEQIRRLLKPGGLIFVHAADISKNPYAILLGDQCYHYTPQIIANIFRHYGFEFSVLECSWCPREMIGIAQSVSGERYGTYCEDLHIYRCVEYVDCSGRKLRELAVPAGGVGVLGTSGTGAFVDSVLCSKVAFFVDENLNRVGSRFRDKDVLHPESLRESDVVIIPYGPLSHVIKGRFSREYRGQFMCL